LINENKKMDLDKIVSNVNSKESFLLFIEALMEDFNVNSKDWENKTIPEYLDALHASIDGMDGFYKYRNIEVPQNIPWFVFSDAMMSARIYE
jgi:hypothetical protein